MIEQDKSFDYTTELNSTMVTTANDELLRNTGLVDLNKFRIKNIELANNWDKPLDLNLQLEKLAGFGKLQREHHETAHSRNHNDSHNSSDHHRKQIHRSHKQQQKKKH